MRKTVVIFGVFLFIVAATLFSVTQPGTVIYVEGCNEYIEIGVRPLGGQALVIGFFAVMVIAAGILMEKSGAAFHSS